MKANAVALEKFNAVHFERVPDQFQLVVLHADVSGSSFGP